MAVASNGLAVLLGLVLAWFTARRWLFLLAAHQPQKTQKVQESRPSLLPWPAVLLLAPFRDEAAALPDLLAHLEQLNYPPNCLTMVLVDDGTTDGSREAAQRWARAVANRHLLSLGRNVGKAAALNAALARFPQAELVAVFDADERPSPDALRHLIQPFADARVGAVNGRRAVSNPLASAIASHATFENLVHQQVTMRAKERLNLAPAILGSNCVYRRTALAQVGGFQPGALLEDSDLTLKLARAGWRIRFVPEAVSVHAVPKTLGSYWQQHTRWASGFQAVARQQAAVTLRARHLPWRLRLELLTFSLGYLDRVVWLLALGWVGMKTAVSRRPPRTLSAVLFTSLITPFIQVLAALRQSQAPPALRRRMVWLPLFLLLDMGMAVVGTVRRTIHWETRRGSS